jgi:hypothetical protein
VLPPQAQSNVSKQIDEAVLFMRSSARILAQ